MLVDWHARPSIERTGCVWGRDAMEGDLFLHDDGCGACDTALDEGHTPALKCGRCPAVFHYECAGYYDEQGAPYALQLVHCLMSRWQAGVLSSCPFDALVVRHARLTGPELPPVRCHAHAEARRHHGQCCCWAAPPLGCAAQ